MNIGISLSVYYLIRGIDINSTSIASTTSHVKFKIQFQIRIKSLHPSVKTQQALRPQ